MNNGYIADQLIYFYTEISRSDLKVLRFLSQGQVCIHRAGFKDLEDWEDTQGLETVSGRLSIHLYIHIYIYISSYNKFRTFSFVYLIWFIAGHCVSCWTFFSSIYIFIFKVVISVCLSACNACLLKTGEPLDLFASYFDWKTR